MELNLKYSYLTDLFSCSNTKDQAECDLGRVERFHKRLAER